MKSLMRCTVSFAALFLSILPLAAQDEAQAFPLDTDFGVVPADGWQITPAAESSGVDGAFFAEHTDLEANIAANDTVTMLLLTPAQVAAVLEFAGQTTDNWMLAAFFVVEAVYGGSIGIDPLDTITSTRFAGVEAVTVSYAFPDDGFEGELFILVMDDATNAWLIAHAYGELGSIQPAREDIVSMLNSVTAIERPAEASASGEPCIVSTDRDRTATVRVGPGEHRTALTFLKANQDYIVEGRFVEDDGDVWYRLVKDEVDPGSSAAELWTAAEGLSEIGGCDTVGEAAAPPLRPIIQARPTSVPGGGGSTTTTDPAEGLIIPASGTWLFVYNAVALVSCQGTNTIEVPISELDWPPSELLTIESNPDGSFLYVEEFLHVRINDTAYLGDYNVDGSNIQAYLFPQSSTSLSGEYRENFVWNGWNCSGTIRLSGRLQ